MTTDESKFAKIDQIAMWIDLSCRPMALKEIEAALALALSDGLDDTTPSSSIESLLKAVEIPFCINSSGSVEYRSLGSVGYAPKQEIPDDGRIRVALTCLKVLTEPRNENILNLLPYAGEFLLSHLEMVDLSQTDLELRQIAGQLIFELFNTDFGVDSMFWIEKSDGMSDKRWYEEFHPWMKSIRASWLVGGNGVQQIVRWLSDAAVVSGIHSEEGKLWVSRMMQPRVVTRKILFGHAAQRMAIHVLQDSFFGLEHATALNFWEVFLEDHSASWHEYRGLPDTFNGDYLALDVPMNVERIRNVLAATRGFCDDTPDGITDLNLALTLAEIPSFFHSSTEHREARATAARAILLKNPLNWRAINALARATERMESIPVLKYGLDTLGADDTWLEDPRHSAIFSELCIRLINAYFWANPWSSTPGSTENFEYGMELLHKCLKEKREAAYKVMAKVFYRIQVEERWDCILELVDTLNSQCISWDMCKMILDYIYVIPRFHNAFLEAVKASSRLDFIERTYQPRIDMAVKNRSSDELCWFQYLYATALSDTNGKADQIEQLWNEVFGHLPSIRWRRSHMIDCLRENCTPSLFKKALAAGYDSEDADRYLSYVRTLKSQVDDQLNKEQISLSFARYHKLGGHLSKARAEASETIRRCITAQSSNDPLEKANIYNQITQACAVCDDDENAVASFALMRLAWVQSLDTYNRAKAERDGQHQEDVISNNANSSDYTIEIGCTQEPQPLMALDTSAPRKSCSLCYETIPGSQDVWWCKDCHWQTVFDSSCHKKVLHNEPQVKRITSCNSSHTFLKIPAVEQNRYEYLPMGLIVVGDKMISLEDWKLYFENTYL